MSGINKEISVYISAVRKNLICTRKLKKTIITDFRNSVLDFAEERKITDINELYAHFGTPEEVAKTYLADADPKEIKKNINTKKVILTALIIALLMYAAGVIIIYTNARLTEIRHVTFESWSDPEIPSELMNMIYN